MTNPRVIIPYNPGAMTVLRMLPDRAPGVSRITISGSPCGAGRAATFQERSIDLVRPELFASINHTRHNILDLTDEFCQSI